jgi:DNA (cytosine-5)-methyltransferase 1
MRVASLFSGVGGLDLGFIRAGHRIVFANDLYEDAVETYRLNIGNHIKLADITTVPADEIPDHDILIGGFPCQGFSVANVGRNSQDERNKLYLELLRILTFKRPLFFVAENVKGILSLERGAVFQMILTDLRKAGYTVHHKLLNAADFGVPQRRERVIIVGVRSDVPWDFEFPVPTHSINGQGRKKWVSVAEALSNVPSPDEPHNLKNHTYSKFKLKFNGYLGNRSINPNLPAPTVTARGDDRGGVVVLHHPSNTRRMSVRELATIQSFPLDFEFYGNNSSAYRQIGNAVPWPLAYAVAKQFPKAASNFRNANTKKAVSVL